MREIIDNVIERVAPLGRVAVHRAGHHLRDAVLLCLDTGGAQKLRERTDDPLGDLAAGDDAVEPAGSDLNHTAQAEAELARFKVAAVGKDGFERVGGQY